MIVSLTLSIAALFAIGLASPGHADEADTAGNGWGNDSRGTSASV
jgi:hypothetical protein